MTMPVAVQWYDKDQRILIYLIHGRWTPTEIVAALDRVRELRQEVQAPIYHILDFTASERVPLGLLGIYNDISHRLEGNYELTIIVHANQWIRILVNSFIQLARPLNLYFAGTVDEALAIVHEKAGMNNR
jgi:hypothetical protein